MGYQAVSFAIDGQGGQFESERAARREKYQSTPRSVYTPNMPEPFRERISLRIDGRDYPFPFCGDQPDQSYSLVQFGQEAIVKIGVLKYEGKNWFSFDDAYTKLDRLSGLPMGRVNTDVRTVELRKPFEFELDSMPFLDLEKEANFSCPAGGSFWNNFSGPTSSRYTDQAAIASDVEILRNWMPQENLQILLTAYKIYLTDPKKAGRYIEEHYDTLIPPQVKVDRGYALAGHSILKRRSDAGLERPLGMGPNEVLPRDGSVHLAHRVQMMGNQGWRNEPGVPLS